MSKAPATIDRAHVEKSLAIVRARIDAACAQSGRQPQQVAVLAVTKGFGPEAIDAALAAGLTDIGENYYQEAAVKFAHAAWPPIPVRRHFIGRLQRNKARRIAELFDAVQTIDRIDAAKALDEGARASAKMLDVLIQVNIAEDQRQGVPLDGMDDFVSGLSEYEHLRVRGLMAIGPLDSARTHQAFAAASALYTRLQQKFSSFDMLSMGMSGDLEEAVRAGSTMVRLGTALFGPRTRKGQEG